MTEEKKYLEKIGKKDLFEFIQIMENLDFKFDSEKFKDIVFKSLKYYNSSKEEREEVRYLQEIENRWYDSLENGNPDYSVYDGVYYLADVWVCWKKYSRNYLRNIVKHVELPKINSICDLGNGVGYTSAALKQIFNCDVYGTNLKETMQYKIVQEVAKDVDFKTYEDSKEIGKVDMIFASEYFEHFEKPLEHLDYVLGNLDPTHVFFANAFNTISIGHFNTYIDNGEKYPAKKMGRMFSKKLRDLGYEKVETKCWNNRPTYYRKK